MKFKKMLGSIITSFLFIILILTLVLQLSFSVIRSMHSNFSDNINREFVLGFFIPNSDREFRNSAVKYIDGYINYVFYKRSYPTFNTVGNDDKTFIKNANELKEKLELDYDTIIKIRSINSLISNNSIFLLINVFAFLIFLLIWISTKKIKFSFRLLGYALIVSSFIFFVIGARLYGVLYENNDDVLYIFALSVVDNDFKRSFYKLCLSYLVTGLITLLIEYTISKLKK